MSLEFKGFNSYETEQGSPQTSFQGANDGKLVHGSATTRSFPASRSETNVNLRHLQFLRYINYLRHHYDFCGGVGLMFTHRCEYLTGKMRTSGDLIFR